jgi:hypothetical protein
MNRAADKPIEGLMLANTEDINKNITMMAFSYVSNAVAPRQENNEGG